MNQFPGTNYHDLNLDWILEQVKNCLAEWETTKGEWESAEAEINAKIAYINNYFANLDVSDEISDKIDAMIASGELLTLIAPQVAVTARQSTRDWLDEHETAAGESIVVIDDTLSIEGAAADAKATGDSIADLRSEFNHYLSGDLPLTIIKDEYIKIDGVVAPYTGWDRTDYIPVSDYALITAKSSVACDYNVFYDSTKTKICSFKVYTTDKVFQVPDNAAYVIFSNAAEGMENFVARFETKSDRDAREGVKNLFVNQNNIVTSHFNMIDLCTFEDGYYYTYMGNKTASATTSVATPIRIESGKTYYAKNVRLVYSFFMYEDGTYLQLSNTDTLSGSFTATKNGYLNLTVTTENKSIAVFTDDSTLYNSDGTESYYTPNKLDIGNAPHIFRVGSTRAYASLLEGIIAAERYKDSIVYVDPGTYDMVQEFKTKYGSGYFTAENYLTQENHRGCPLTNGVHVIGYGGVTVTGGLQSTDSQDAIGDWSIFSAGDDAGGDNGYGFTLENITIKSTSQHIRYLVHDEYGLTNYNYINKYLNIHFIVFPGYVKRCIGGGLGSHGYILIDNCTISAPAYDATIRGINYHNDANTGALNEIYIKNCYIPNGTVGITWYGQTPATEKSMLYVNNCYLQAEPVKKAETETAPYENVDIVSWCNTIVP